MTELDVMKFLRISFEGWREGGKSVLIMALPFVYQSWDLMTYVLQSNRLHIRLHSKFSYP